MPQTDTWDDGTAYDAYVGRWSRAVAVRFVRWLALPPGLRWLEIGCGSGALTAAILDGAAPHTLVACDRSPSFVAHVRQHITDPRARFIVSAVDQLPTIEGGFDACVAGLVLNFLPDAAESLRVAASRTHAGATVAGYVWDYDSGMEMMRVFWDAAAAIDPAAAALDEAVRFPQCRPDALLQVFHAAGLDDVEVTSIDVPTEFRDFEDYWNPFLGGQGPAPGYLAQLPEERRGQLRAAVQSRLPSAATGSIVLTARAWAIRGVVPPP